MKITRKEANPRLKAAILEVVGNQMRDNDPPETKQTYDRLIREGHPDAEARRLIGCIVATEVVDIIRKDEVFNLRRFVQALNNLPDMPGGG